MIAWLGRIRLWLRYPMGRKLTREEWDAWHDTPFAAPQEIADLLGGTADGAHTPGGAT